MSKSTLLYIVFLLCVISLTAVLFAKTSNMSKTLAIFAVYAVAFGILIYTKTSLESIGLSTTTATRGILYALPFVAGIGVISAVAFAISPSLFQDSRYQQSTQQMLQTIFIIIPLYTVILEEVLFRGLLFSAVQSTYSTTIALLISAVAFGLWHIFSAQSVQLTNIQIPQFVVICGVIVATSLAGIFFAWLRVASGSLLTPIIIHWAINSTGVVLAYFAWKS